jgi:hypothetical protein
MIKKGHWGLEQFTVQNRHWIWVEREGSAEEGIRAEFTFNSRKCSGYTDYRSKRR